MEETSRVKARQQCDLEDAREVTAFWAYFRNHQVEKLDNNKDLEREIIASLEIKPKGVNHINMK